MELKLIFLLSTLIFYSHSIHLTEHKSFDILINFTCAAAKDEFEMNPEMRTIAVLEHKNGFSKDFTRNILKCLPEAATKTVFKSNESEEIDLPCASLVIIIGDHLKRFKVLIYKRV